MIARSIAAVLLALGLAALAHAQQIGGFPPGVFLDRGALDPVVASYSGPGDVVSGAYMWWGLRCYTATYSGNVVDITDSATGNTTGTRLQCSTGGVISAVVSASACTFVTGNACSPLLTTCALACNVEKLYDQSGNTNCNSAACDIYRPVNANRPTLTLNCVNTTLSCISFVGTALTLTSVSQVIPTAAQPLTYSIMSVRTGSFTTEQYIASDSGINNIIEYKAANTVQMYAGSAFKAATASDSSFHALQAILSGTSSVFDVDGTDTPENTPGTSGITSGGHILLGNSGAASYQLTEAGVWNSAFTTGAGSQAAKMCHNQRLYWLADSSTC